MAGGLGEALELEAGALQADDGARDAGERDRHVVGGLVRIAHVEDRQRIDRRDAELDRVDFLDPAALEPGRLAAALALGVDQPGDAVEIADDLVDGVMGDGKAVDVAVCVRSLEVGRGAARARRRRVRRRA